MHATIASPSPSLSPDKTHESEYESESGRHESKSESESSKSGLESDSSPDSDSSLPNTGREFNLFKTIGVGVEFFEHHWLLQVLAKTGFRLGSNPRMSNPYPDPRVAMFGCGPLLTNQQKTF